MEPPSLACATCDIVQWLASEAPALAFSGRMLEGFAERLQSAGLPVARITFHVQLINPQVSRVMREWRRGRGVVESTRPHGIERTASYVGSPVQFVVDRREWLIRRLDEAAAREFPLLGELRADGLTHYAMAPLFFSDGTVNAASWASDAPDGFTDTQLALLRGIAPVFTLLVEMRAVRRMAGELMSTYLGRETGMRVLAGEIQRGHMQKIRAAIMVCDLRGFTRYSNTHDEAKVIARLNDYFDAVAGPIERHGGEILKFQGDGVMAVFRDGGAPGEATGDAGTTCRRALAAAVDALAAIDGTNARPDDRPDPPIAVGVALHHGVVAYGNIGARNRLDFTVVGQDVNLAYRIERQCALLALRIVMSAIVAQEAGVPVRALGTFALRGFEAPEALFTVEEPADLAAKSPET